MNQFDKKSKAWSALFSEPMSELVKRYTASVSFDQRLWKADIEGSLAHAGMLAAQASGSSVMDALDAFDDAYWQSLGSTTLAHTAVEPVR